MKTFILFLLFAALVQTAWATHGLRRRCLFEAKHKSALNVRAAILYSYENVATLADCEDKCDDIDECVTLNYIRRRKRCILFAISEEEATHFGSHLVRASGATISMMCKIKKLCTCSIVGDPRLTQYDGGLVQIEKTGTFLFSSAGSGMPVPHCQFTAYVTVVKPEPVSRPDFYRVSELRIVVEAGFDPASKRFEINFRRRPDETTEVTITLAGNTDEIPIPKLNKDYVAYERNGFVVVHPLRNCGLSFGFESGRPSVAQIILPKNVYHGKSTLTGLCGNCDGKKNDPTDSNIDDYSV